MSYSLNGKTAIVTGGSRGIGAAIAQRLASDGANVVITYNSNSAAADETVEAITKAGGKAVAVQADATNPDAAHNYINAATENFGKIDILVHNAGVAGFAHVSEAGLDAMREQFAVNVDGVYAGTHAAQSQMNDGGRIIVIGSVNAHSMPMPGGAIYGATKAAVAGLVRGWARDLGGRNILVNAIQPGPVNTDMNPEDGDFADALTPMTALGRYAQPEEIANLATFLASDQSSYITGATIDIDGGMTV